MMSFQLRLVSYYLEPISFAIFFLALLYYVVVLNKSSLYKVITGFYLVISILQTWALYEIKMNVHTYHLTYLATGLALAFYFYHILQNKSGKVMAKASGIITSCYFLINVVLLEEKLFDSIGYVITSFGIVVLAFLYLYQVMNHVTEKAITSDFNFWFISSQLIYHIGAFGIFLSFNTLTTRIMKSELYVYENRKILTQLWGAHNVLLFLSALFVWFGIVWVVYHRKSPSY